MPTRVSLGNQTHMYSVTTCQTPLISLLQKLKNNITLLAYFI